MTSVREQITSALVTKLESMSVANGSTFDYPGGVSEFESDGQRLVTLPAVSLFLTAESPKEFVNNVQVGATLTYAIEIWSRHPAADPDSSGRYVERQVTDVERVLLTDTDLGGLSQPDGLRMGGWKRQVPLSPDGYSMGLLLAQIMVMVDYRHRHDNPEVVS